MFCPIKKITMNQYKLKEPLVDYPWNREAIKLIKWSKSKPIDYRAFVFDVCMSLAYIDSTSGVERFVEDCPNCPEEFNAHIGFINLCSPCYENAQIWQYQKAAKPQSGALGKLSSEMILKFIEILFDDFIETYSIGGTEVADALIKKKNGIQILAEVKSAPLLTYPLLVQKVGTRENHSSISLTSSQFRELKTALYMHKGEYIPLGKVKESNWPFRAVAAYFEDENNEVKIKSFFNTWSNTRKAYEDKNRASKFYYLANASGKPPKEARERDNWPSKESISDSKTSAGMDRTDDIKKGIYQVLKLGIQNKNNRNIKTAIISNLPAFRHGKDYVDPFIDMIWGTENDLVKDSDIEYLRRKDMRYAFDYLITLTNPLIRDNE